MHPFLGLFFISVYIHAKSWFYPCGNETQKLLMIQAYKARNKKRERKRDIGRRKKV